eukprot:scaffold377_cov563-Prasinococcus_capsulatus_cf.AAC.9
MYCAAPSVEEDHPPRETMIVSHQQRAAPRALPAALAPIGEEPSEQHRTGVRGGLWPPPTTPGSAAGRRPIHSLAQSARRRSEDCA